VPFRARLTVVDGGRFREQSSSFLFMLSLHRQRGFYILNVYVNRVVPRPLSL
jgi:hypothetical protein